MNIRKFENFHILLWLLKDTSWLLGWKILGTIMIIPTLTFAVILTFKTRVQISDFIHNIAITLWICANSFWMLSEFFEFQDMQIYAIIPFSTGLALLLVFYTKLYAKTFLKNFSLVQKK